MALRELKLSLVGKTEGEVLPIEQQKNLLSKLYKTKSRQCAYCGHFSPTLRGLELDHLDGNHGNFDEDNLDLACHWCHAARHLEFAMRAGGVLVLWDFPQEAISRLTMQSLQTGYLRSIYDALVTQGVERRENNMPDGHMSDLDMRLRARIKRGDQKGAERQMAQLQALGVRLTFPMQYLNTQQPPPPGFSKQNWGEMCAYYGRLRNNILVDNDRRAMLAKFQRDLRKGINPLEKKRDASATSSGTDNSQ